ncbi:Ring-h2 finger protein atl34, partial [Globisporangium splendens]
MVFISLERFVDSANVNTQQSHLPITQMHQLAASNASVHVVVTPGSPVKKDANDALLRSRFSFRSQKKSSTSSSLAVTPFLVYVTDDAVRSKWVVAKSGAEYLDLRKRIQQCIGSCQKFSCCGPLRRIAKSPLHKHPRKKRSDNAVASQYGACGVIQEYINDLLIAVMAREHQCDSTVNAGHELALFLDITSHRAAAAEYAMQISAERDDGPVSNSPSEHSSHDESECPICCGDLSSEHTLRLPCSHEYHSACVRVWLNMQHTCPVCRVPLDPAQSS